jgi:hypothetical protein
MTMETTIFYQVLSCFLQKTQSGYLDPDICLFRIKKFAESKKRWDQILLFIKNAEEKGWNGIRICYVLYTRVSTLADKCEINFSQFLKEE